MRRTTHDGTLERNYIQKWQFWIEEYEQTKAKKHPRFRFMNDFYRYHQISRQTFCKYYNRYRQSASTGAFLPLKRGPRWKSRRPDVRVEEAVLAAREKGLNRYEIAAVLKTQGWDKIPSPSGVYTICKRGGLNRLKRKQYQEKRKIIKERAGQLGHMDCHYLSKDLLVNESTRYYVVAVMDDYTRLSWAEVVTDVKSLTVMFAGIKSINLLNQRYAIQFEEMLTDNGSEFCCRSHPSEHPFERMLLELGVKHRYTRPYRPQTNGKIERFWRTLNEDLLDETTFDSLAHLKEELQQYLLYYNEHRPHQALKGLTPLQFLTHLSTN